MPTPATCTCETPNHNHSAIYIAPQPTLTDDLANVLTLVQRVFVGSPTIRDEITRALDRYVENERERMDQLSADRAIVGSMVRDGLAMSRERVEINGVLVPF